jgi:hypothetical protein
MINYGERNRETIRQELKRMYAEAAYVATEKERRLGKFASEIPSMYAPLSRMGMKRDLQNEPHTARRVRRYPVGFL